MVLFKDPEFAITLSANYVTLNVEDLGHLQDSVDMVTNGSSHVVGRTCLTPLVDKLAAAQ